MNALIALVHFCEVHGPSIVFCTQPTHTNEHPPAPLAPADASAAIAAAMAQLNMSTSTISIPTAIMDKHHHHLAPHGPSSLSSTPSTGEPPTPPSTMPRGSSPVPSWKKPPAAAPLSCRSSSSSSSSTTCSTAPSTTAGAAAAAAASCCAACSAQLPSVLPDGEAKRLVTRDSEDPSVEYVGAKAPQQLHLYKAVRLACVRSLTTEFCPGREGPVLFGDEENGYVMSYLFKIRDAQARGEARFYAIMILMTDRVFLISCWPFLVSSFKSMAVNLQEKADAVFQREKEVRERVHPFANRRVAAPISQEQFLRRRSNSASLRSLVDLLGIKDIYIQIHVQFCYILKLSARRRMEKITAGRSPSEAYLKMRDEYRTKRQQPSHPQPESHKSNRSCTSIAADSCPSSSSAADNNATIPSTSSAS